MFGRGKLNSLDDFFLTLDKRNGKEVYFYRISGYSSDMDKFLASYFGRAAKGGVVISEKIPNPDERQLGYYEEIMGLNFKMDKGFFLESISKWLPRVNGPQREALSESIFNTLDLMRKSGKNENMLKNAYIKFMCWLYYKFERVINLLGLKEVPKILYEGDISLYELKMLGIIADAGCDVLLIAKNGAGAYLKTDPSGKECFEYKTENMGPFPKDFSLVNIRNRAEEEKHLSKMYGGQNTKEAASNTWIGGSVFDDCLKPYSQRGDNDSFIYNVFARVNGAENKATYCGDIFKWKRSLEEQGRSVFVLNDIPVPTVAEINRVNSGGYKTSEQLILNMALKIEASFDELRVQAKKAFCDLMRDEFNKDGENLNRLKNKAVYLICWFNRYAGDIFKGFKNMETMPVFVYFNVCKNNFEALFMRFMSYLPLDMVILNPDLSRKCLLSDSRLFEKNFEFSLKIDKFPESAADIELSTVAYVAERELDHVLYNDTGIYRNMQYGDAVSVTLQTMYEEMYMLWNEDLSMRPNFEVSNGKVIMPTLMCKVCGVKNGDVEGYWNDIKRLFTDSMVFIKDAPYIKSSDLKNTQAAAQFLKNRKIEKDKIKNSPVYKYGIFREDVQEHMLNKLQELIDSGIIKGTFSNGAEYKIISVFINMSEYVMRLIQKFDFTKKNPKLLIINPGEKPFSFEDAIFVAYMHFVGFDIAMFVPTGYQVIERNFSKPVFVEYQIGEYLYDLTVPQMDRDDKKEQRESIFNRIFKRGR